MVTLEEGDLRDGDMLQFAGDVRTFEVNADQADVIDLLLSKQRDLLDLQEGSRVRRARPILPHVNFGISPGRRLSGECQSRSGERGRSDSGQAIASIIITSSMNEPSSSTWKWSLTSVEAQDCSALIAAMRGPGVRMRSTQDWNSIRNR